MIPLAIKTLYKAHLLRHAFLSSERTDNTVEVSGISLLGMDTLSIILEPHDSVVVSDDIVDQDRRLRGKLHKFLTTHRSPTSFYEVVSSAFLRHNFKI